MVASIAWGAAAALIHPRVFLLDAVLHLAPGVLAVAVAAASLRESLTRTEPVAFVVREGLGFAVPPNRAVRYLAVSQVLMMAFLAGQTAILIDWTGEIYAATPVAGTVFAVITVTAVASLGFVGLFVMAGLRGRPRVELTPRGVMVSEVSGSRTIPWEALRRGLPLWRTDREKLTLTVDRPELVVQHGLLLSSARRPTLHLQHLRVHPWFLAAAIHFYVDHPDRRAAAGTPAEYERLLTELGV